MKATGPSSLHVENIYLPLNHLFTQASKKAFQTRISSTIHLRKVEAYIEEEEAFYVEDRVKYFGSRSIGERGIFDAATRVADQINKLSAAGYVTAVLGGPLMLYQLRTEPHQIETFAIISYVALTPEGISYLEKNPSKLEFREGEIPPGRVKSFQRSSL